MAWSDAARRASILARRLKRVTGYQPKNYAQTHQKRRLMAELGERARSWRENASAAASRESRLRREKTYERAKASPTAANMRKAKAASSDYLRSIYGKNRRDY